MGVLSNAAVATKELQSDPDEAAVCLDDIRLAAQRASDLCRQLVAYSGKGRFVVENHDVSALVQEMTDLLRVSLAKKTKLVVKAAPQLPAVSGDASQLRQVVMNLVTNASEALDGEVGTVSVSTEMEDLAEDELLDDGSTLPAGPYISIRVADTGGGMDDATIGRIFEPFFTTKFTGRGLGLAAVQGIVRAHKGTLRACLRQKAWARCSPCYFPPSTSLRKKPRHSDGASLRRRPPLRRSNVMKIVWPREA